MSSSDLIQWGGLAAMLTGVAFILNGLLAVVDPLSPFLLLILIVAVLLAVAGLAGFHALQKGSYGRIGQAGFYTAIVASLVQILGLLTVPLGGATLRWLITAGTFGQLVGFVLYGAATLQARVLPRWCGVAFIVALPIGLTLGNFGNSVFGLIWLALGYALWSRKEAAGRQTTRVS